MPVGMKLFLDIRSGISKTPGMDIPDFNKLSEPLLTTSSNAFW